MSQQSGAPRLKRPTLAKDSQSPHMPSWSLPSTRRSHPYMMPLPQHTALPPPSLVQGSHRQSFPLLAQDHARAMSLSPPGQPLAGRHSGHQQPPVDGSLEKSTQRPDPPDSAQTAFNSSIENIMKWCHSQGNHNFEMQTNLATANADIARLKAQLAASTAESYQLRRMNQKLLDERQTIEGYSSTVNRLYEEVKSEVEQTAKTLAEYQDDRRNWLAQFEEMQRQRNEYQADTLVKCQQSSQMEEQLVLFREKAESAMAERDDLNQKLGESRLKLMRLDENFERMQRGQEQSKNELSHLKANVTRVEELLAGEKLRNRALQSEVEDCRTRCASHHDDKENLLRQLENAKSREEDQENEMKKMTCVIVELEEALKECRFKWSALQDDHSNVLADFGKLKSKEGHLKNERIKMADEIAELKGQIQNMKAADGETQKSHLESNRQHLALQSELLASHQKMKDVVVSLSEEKRNLSQRISALETELKTANSALAESVTQRERISSNVNETADKHAEELNKMKSDFQKQMDGLTQQLASKVEGLDDLRRKLTASEGHGRQLEESVRDLRRKLTDNQARFEELQKSRVEIEREAIEAKRQSSETTLRLHNKQIQLEDIERALQASANRATNQQATLDRLNADLEKTKISLADKDSKNQHLAYQLNDASTKLSIRETEITSLKRQMATMSSHAAAVASSSCTKVNVSQNSAGFPRASTVQQPIPLQPAPLKSALKKTSQFQDSRMPKEVTDIPPIKIKTETPQSADGRYKRPFTSIPNATITMSAPSSRFNVLNALGNSRTAPGKFLPRTLSFSTALEEMEDESVLSVMRVTKNADGMPRRYERKRVAKNCFSNRVGRP